MSAKVAAPRPDASEAARLIKAVRQVRGWTQLQLAAQLSVSESTIANWENERAIPHWVWLGPLRELVKG